MPAVSEDARIEMADGFSFELTSVSASTAARLGVLHTRHGAVQTPVFMPVGTAGTVKALPHEWLESLDARIILANTYHLYLRPGPERIGRLGGLHRFMSWNRAILTDSGGYQIYSHRDLRRISEEGVIFQSHLDGSTHFLTPEKVTDIQRLLGSDIAMALDDCTPYPCSRPDAEKSMELSMRWARRCVDRWRACDEECSSALFGIVQGSVYPELRARSVEALLALDPDGIAVGGLSVGEPKSAMWEVLEATLPLLPPGRPRYLMGVGTPRDIIRSVSLGADMFDCVLPTRNARNGCLFTSEGRILIKNAVYSDDNRPLDPACSCLTCRRYTRAYLRHLYMSGEYLSAILNTMHNVSFYLDMMCKIREAIASNSFGKWLECMEKWPE
jgi:queuine tRNA-ribosyltransferase